MNEPAAPSPEDAIRVGSERARDMGVALRNGVKIGGSLLITWSVAMVVKLRVPVHLGPVRQGHFGFAESFAMMFFASLSLGVDTHIMKETAVRPKYASEIIGGVFALRLGLSLVLFAGMIGVLRITGRSDDIVFASAVFGVTCFWMALNATLGVVLQAIARVNPAVVANVAAKAVWGAGLLVGLHFDAPLPVLALPGLIGELLRAAILLPAARRGAHLHFRIEVPAVKAGLIDSIPYFVNGVALGILSSLGMSVLEFIRKDEREVGWFAASQNLAYLCMLLTPLIFWVVMPVLSRAQARSKEEGMFVFRRCLEGIVVAIVPFTVLISAGSDVIIRFAFGAKYAPAHTALSILSLVFIMTYMNSMLAMNLVVMGRGWAVTIISVGSIFITATLMFVFVPVGRHLLAEGGESAGAAAAVIGSEGCVLVGMLSRFKDTPLDSRNVRVFSKSVALAAFVLVADRFLRGFGPSRLVVDAAIYFGVAPIIGVVQIKDLRYVLALLLHKGAEPRSVRSAVQP